LARWQALEQYRDSGDSQANDRFLLALGEALGDDHPFVRWQAGLALAQQREGVSKLTEAVRSPDQALPTQLAAIDALGRCQTTEADAPLIHALRSNTSVVRQSAAEALANRRSTSAVPHLIEALQDPDPWVRRAAAYGLGQIGQPEATTPLLAGLQDRSVLVRRSAAYALGAIRAKSALPHLKISLTDPDMITRCNAAGAIGRLGLTEAVPLLNQLVDDPKMGEEVKAAAKHAVELLTRPRWLQTLLDVGSRLRWVHA
jgi:HEAT repeat protein